MQRRGKCIAMHLKLRHSPIALKIEQCAQKRSLSDFCLRFFGTPAPLYLQLWGGFALPRAGRIRLSGARGKGNSLAYQSATARQDAINAKRALEVRLTVAWIGDGRGGLRPFHASRDALDAGCRRIAQNASRGSPHWSRLTSGAESRRETKCFEKRKQVRTARDNWKLFRHTSPSSSFLRVWLTSRK